MRLRWRVWLVAVPLVTALLGLICCGNFLSIFLVAGVVGTWVLTAVALTLAVFFSKDANTAPKWQEPWMRFLAAASVTIVGGVYFGGHVHEWQAQRARTFVAEIVPKLDQYFREHGKFPDDLSPIGNSAVPSVAGWPFGYSGDDTEFRFEYPARWTLFDYWQYSSDRRKWQQD